MIHIIIVFFIKFAPVVPFEGTLTGISYAVWFLGLGGPGIISRICVTVGRERESSATKTRCLKMRRKDDESARTMWVPKGVLMVPGALMMSMGKENGIL